MQMYVNHKEHTILNLFHLLYKKLVDIEKGLSKEKKAINKTFLKREGPITFLPFFYCSEEA